MQPVLLAQKGTTSQTHDSHSRRVPVTHLLVDQLHLVQVMRRETSGYDSLKFSFGSKKKTDMPTRGQLAKVGITIAPILVKEVRISTGHPERLSVTADAVKSNDQEIKVGSPITASFMFKVGDLIDVTGQSKGKGFQGGVKRHRFAGGPKTHGQSDRWRAPGSVGATTTPGRTFKGQRMAGRMGTETVTVRNLTVLEVSENKITVTGLVPGNAGTMITVRLAKEANG